ncbi:MAG: paraquat-inducible protein A [Phycisphaerales bacterium]|nr:paraquat-inducible protein A [Phycisphaerales bacterium]
MAVQSLLACPCCGLVQHCPAVSGRQRVRCARCHERLRPRSQRSAFAGLTAALALSALILYPLAVTLPMLRIERLGRTNETSIIEGVTSMLAHGDWFVGGVVLLCSLILPLAKLLALLVVNMSPTWLASHHRARTYQFIEFTGRWGMLDVLLVAILVAALKLGDLVDVTPGPAALAFTGVVVLSLCASASFNPLIMWDSEA